MEEPAREPEFDERVESAAGCANRIAFTALEPYRLRRWSRPGFIGEFLNPAGHFVQFVCSFACAPPHPVVHPCGRNSSPTAGNDRRAESTGDLKFRDAGTTAFTWTACLRNL